MVKKVEVMGMKKNYEATLKAKVALEVIKNQKSNAEIASEYKIPLTNLHEWHNKAINDLSQLFIPQSEHAKKQKIMQQEVEGLHKIIGELTIENNYLKKKLVK